MRKKALSMNLVVVQSVVLPVRHKREIIAAVVVMVNQNGRCMLRFVLLAGKKRLYLSSPVVIGLFTAEIVLRHNPEEIAIEYSRWFKFNMNPSIEASNTGA
jgi:hypothetical protein